jgi:hypothetical protein
MKLCKKGQKMNILAFVRIKQGFLEQCFTTFVASTPVFVFFHFLSQQKQMRVKLLVLLI